MSSLVHVTSKFVHIMYFSSELFNNLTSTLFYFLSYKELKILMAFGVAHASATDIEIRYNGGGATSHSSC